LLSSAEDVPANQGAREFEECFMNVRAAFEANAKTTETMEPRVSPFDDPTAFAEAATVFGAAPCDDRPDAALAKSATMRIGIVATVGVNDLGLAKRPTACAANLRDGVDQRQQLRDIVAIRACQNRADRNAVCVYEHVVFGPRSRAIRGVRPSFWPAPTARTGLDGLTNSAGISRAV
jgi:hypothetical protein